MGKKRTAEDYHQTAEANGWVEGAHEEEDRVILEHDGPTDRYKKNQQEALDQWAIFKGLPAAECLRENCPVPSNTTLKDFARWYCQSRRGQLDQRPTDKSVKNIMKKFFGGFKRVTKTKIPDQLRTDIYVFIREVLVKQSFVTTKTREKYLFNDDDLEHCVVSLWTEPDHVFIHEVMRGQITFLTQAYCYSGARIGAFVHNCTGEVPAPEGKTEKVVFKGLTWKDVHIYLFPVPDGTTEVILKLTQRWVKNNKDPENHVSEVAAYEHSSIKFDCTGFLLHMAFRDSVLMGFDSPAQLWEQRVPEGEPMLELRKDPSKLNLPVLRTVTRHGGLSSIMLDESTFRYYFKQMVRNAGYYGVLTIHALRRAFANAVDKIATSGERNKLLGWASSDVCNKKYLDPISSVDGMAAFLGMKQRTDHIKKLRSASVKRAPGLPQELPAERMDEFVRDPKAHTLLQRLRELRQGGADELAIKEAERKFKTYRHWLRNRCLERYKADWLNTRYENIVQSRGKAQPDRSVATSRAQSLFRVIPERARLADMMTSTEPRSRQQKLKSVEDMLSLSTRSYEVMYRPGEEPVGGACPVCQSKLPEAKRTRADHIHACRRREFIAIVKATKGATDARPVRVEYCFLCFRWFNGDIGWEQHCRSHLDSLKPTWCAVHIYCHTMISPGFCPWHWYDENLPAAQRLKQWRRNCDLMDHIDNEHIEKIHVWPALCGCGAEVEDMTALRYHLSDLHGLWKAEWKRFGIRASLNDDEADTVPVPIPMEGGGETGPLKRRKHKQTGAGFVEWSPIHSPGLKDTLPVPSEMPPDGPRLKKKTKSRRRATTERAFVEWSPPSRPHSPSPYDCKRGGYRIDEPPISNPPGNRSISFWNGASSVSVDDIEEAEFNAQAGLEVLLQRADQIDDVEAEGFPSDDCWFEGYNGAEGNTTDPTSLSTPLTDSCTDMFEDFLDPAFFTEDPRAPSPSTESAQNNELQQSVESVDFDLPSLESLLTHRSVRPSSEPHNVSGNYGQPGPTDDGDGAQVTPISAEVGEGHPHALEPTQERRISSGPLPKQSNRVASNCPLCGACISRPPKKGKGHLDMWELAEFCKSHRLKDAETEWAQRGYPRIGWRRLEARLEKFSPAIDSILKAESPSFYRSAFESALARKERYIMENATAGYYGPRGQHIIGSYIVDKFGSELRRRATKDPSIYTRGVADHVVNVLVPEIVVMLIKEDMGVSDASAREILQDSKDIGDILCEDDKTMK